MKTGGMSQQAQAQSTAATGFVKSMRTTGVDVFVVAYAVHQDIRIMGSQTGTVVRYQERVVQNPNRGHGDMNMLLDQTNGDELCLGIRCSRPLWAGNFDLFAARKAEPAVFFTEGKFGRRDATHLVPFCRCNADGYWSSFASFVADSRGAKGMSIEV